MTDERRDVVESTETDPELELDFTVGDPRVTDAEIDRLRELARSGTVETAPHQPYAVNRINEMHGRPAVVAPPDHLVGAMLKRLSVEAEQLRVDHVAGFVAMLGPDETALLRHLTGLDIADAATLLRLDPAGDLINEKARSYDLAGADGLPALVRRGDHDLWHLDALTGHRLRHLWQ